MRLEEVEASSTEQRGQAEGLSKAAADHRRRAEEFRKLQHHIDESESTLTSSDIVQAQVELRVAQETNEATLSDIYEQRRQLVQENLELTVKCDKALEKASKILQSQGSLAQQVGRGLAAEALKVGLGIITEIVAHKPHAADAWVDARFNMGHAIDATKRHVERLETAKEELLETRKLLEVEGETSV